MATKEQLSDPNKKWMVYIHTFPNGKKYVGITSQTPNGRWGLRGQNYTEQCRAIYAAIRKYGWENVSHEIVESDLSKEEAEALEVELICKYKSNDRDKGYNIANGGLYFCGRTSEMHKRSLETKQKKPHVVSEEYKRILSEWYSGSGNPFYGKRHTKESIKKMSLSKSGIKQTLETIEKRVASQRKYYSDHPEELERVKRKRADALKSEEYRKKMREYRQQFGKRVLCVETGKTYTSIKQAARETGIDSSSITHCINNPEKYKRAGKFHWNLHEEE